MTRSCCFRWIAATSLAVIAWSGAGCSGSDGEAAPIRLVDRFTDARIDGSPPASAAPDATEWNFSGGTVSGGSWAPGQQTAAIELTAEGLTGRAAGARPTLFLERPAPAGVGDRLHEIVIRLRVSAGSDLTVLTLGADGPPSAALAAAPGGLTHRTPLVPGPDFRTYTIALDRSFGLGPTARSAITRVVMRPTDEAGAEFTLESVRLVFRKERFASIPTGIGWHGLGEIWRDTVVSRAPETVTWRLDLPTRDPWLDLTLGTTADGPVGFDVAVAAAGDEARAVHAETLTSSERWNQRRVDLSAWAGRTVDLSFSVRGEPGALAFWGSPVVRSVLADDGPGAGKQPRGVIVVVADTLRRHHLTAYGHDRDNSPNISRMASEGVLFRDAISQGTWTKVSVPSILSSLYPSTHEIVSFNDRLPSAAVTLAEALQAAGFATWASSSVPFSGQLTNLHQGVEVLYEAAAIDAAAESKTGRFFVDELVPWLENHRDVPFFALVHAMDAHSPYRPYAPYDTMWTPEADGKRYEKDLAKVKEHIRDPLLKRFGMPNRREMEAAGVDIEAYLAHERAWYDASILALDAEIGRLLETLRRLGREDDTVVALVADHGEEFLEHDSHWHGLTVYSEMIEVPLVLRYPGAPIGGTVVDSTVQTIDMMPTILDLVGLEIPTTAQGRSLVPLWEGTERAGRALPAFAERKVQVSTTDSPEGAFVRSDSYAALSNGWKLIWNVRQGPGAPEFELFDRAADPMDQTDVASENPEIVAELKALIDRWLESARAARLPSDGAISEGLTAAELDRLRALGYL